MQYLHAVVYALGRASLMATYFSYLGAIFGFHHYGKLAGGGLLVAATVALLQYPLLSATLGSLGGDFTGSNSVVLERGKSVVLEMGKSKIRRSSPLSLRRFATQGLVPLRWRWDRLLLARLWLCNDFCFFYLISEDCSSSTGSLLVAATVALLQYPLLSATLGSLDGDFTGSNSVVLEECKSSIRRVF